MSTDIKELFDKYNGIKDDMSSCKLDQQRRHSELEMQVKENATQIGITKTMIHQVSDAVRINAEKVGSVCDSMKPVISQFKQQENKVGIKEKIYIGVAIILISTIILGIVNFMFTSSLDTFSKQLKQTIEKED